ncbi:WD40 repeat domain-containing protein [Breznakiellaceae bacterium SP9]
MIQLTKKNWCALGLGLFAAYMIIAARPVPLETVLKKQWLSSLESDYPIQLLSDVAGGQKAIASTGPGEGIPFVVGKRFGYVDGGGRFLINRENRDGQEKISLSQTAWAAYPAIPEELEIKTPHDEVLFTINAPNGYPLFLDGKVYILSSERNSLSSLNSQGEVLWRHDYGAPLTCFAAGGGFILSGSVDGIIELINAEGRTSSPTFEPGGSRIPVILGCAISRDAAHIALIAGIDDQRFLLLERFEDTYKVSYHEFLKDGFRRPVFIDFIEGDRMVAFEREEGLGVYEVNYRTSHIIPLEGTIMDMDSSGDAKVLFLVTSLSDTDKRLVEIRLPDTIIMQAPFKSRNEYLVRNKNQLIVGSDSALVAFEIGKK